MIFEDTIIFISFFFFTDFAKEAFCYWWVLMSNDVGNLSTYKSEVILLVIYHINIII